MKGRLGGWQKLKILMVNKFLFPNGGSETYMFEVGKQLQKKGHEVQYFGMEHGNRVVGNRVNSYTPNMDFHTGKWNKIFYPFRIIYSRPARKKLSSVLNDFAPDVIHLNNFNFQLTPSIIYEIIKYGKKAGKRIKILYTAHDTQLVCPNHLMRIPSTGKLCQQCMRRGYLECVKNACIHGSKAKSFLAAVEAVLYKRLKVYQWIDCVICPSYFMEQQLLHRKEFQGKTKVLHNFIPEGHLGTAKKEKEDTNRKKEGYVLYFGRFSEEKGIGTLLEVCRQLPKIPFIFAGNGPLEGQVNEIENIKNVGFQEGEGLAKLIREAAFSLVPSECYENCPFSVMESIALGTPVIGSRIGGIPELIEEGGTGDLFGAGDAEELKNKVESLWNEPERLQAYAEECCKKGFYTVGSYCEKLLEVIGRL